MLNFSFNDVHLLSGIAKHMVPIWYVDISGNKLEVIEQNVFDTLLQIDTLFTDNFAACCIGGSKVRLCFTTPYFKSECQSLIPSVSLKLISWILNIGSFVLNFVVLIKHVKNIMRKLKSHVPIYNNQLLLSLCCSQLLLPCYWLTIGMVDLVYGRSFVSYIVKWKTGTFCWILQILSSVGMFASMFNSVLLVTVRCLGVLYPLKQYMQHNTRSIIGTGWTLVFTTMSCHAVLLSIVAVDTNSLCFPLSFVAGRPVLYNIMPILFCFLVPLILLVVIMLTAKMIIAANESKKRLQSNCGKENGYYYYRSLFWNILKALTGLFCSWFPIVLLNLVQVQETVDPLVSAWISLCTSPLISLYDPTVHTLLPWYKKK